MSSLKTMVFVLMFALVVAVVAACAPAATPVPPTAAPQPTAVPVKPTEAPKVLKGELNLLCTPQEVWCAGLKKDNSSLMPG